MEKIDVLLLNFDVENIIQPWIDRDRLYAIHTARKIEDVEQFYKNFEFDLIFLKISQGLIEGFRALDYFRNISPHSKIVVISEKPTVQDAFYYTRHGVHDFRGPFRNVFEFMNIMRYSTQQNIFGNLLDSLKVKLGSKFWKGTSLSLCAAITDTALACLVEAKGEYETVEHLNGVSQYARLIVQKLARTKRQDEIFADNYFQYLFLGSKLHDIGKTNVPEKIIMKPHSLTKQEWEILKTHTHYGYEMLSAIEQSAGGDLQDFFKIAKDIALYHHENYDGTGYPYSLRGKDIPLSARICSLADSYSALASDRPFRKALSHKEICEIILYKQSRKYDPAILGIFRQYNKEFREIYEVFRKNAKTYPDRKIKKQCAWCKSLFLFNKWLPYNELVYGSHVMCPKCYKKHRREP